MGRRPRWLLISAFALGLAGWLWTGRPVHYGALAASAATPDSSGATFRIERVTLTTTTGRRLECLVRSPESHPGRSSAAMLLAGGLRTGRQAVRYISADYDGTAISCDYAWTALVDGSIAKVVFHLPRLRAELIATPEALALAARYLASRRDLRTGRLAAVGASLGVPPVAAWAARDTLPRAVALLYGGGELHRLLEVELRSEIGSGWMRRASARTLGWLLGPLEPLRTVGGIAPRPLLLIAAADDERVPRDAAEKLFDAAREPKRVIWFGGGHMRPSDAELTATLTDSCLAWLAAVLPTPAASP